MITYPIFKENIVLGFLNLIDNFIFDFRPSYEKKKKTEKHVKN